MMGSSPVVFIHVLEREREREREMGGEVSPQSCQSGFPLQQ